jgi:hypothetical protein
MRNKATPSITPFPPPPKTSYMHQLGRLVPIIPVITKADTMTINEAQRFRQEVAGRLQVRRSLPNTCFFGVAVGSQPCVRVYVNLPCCASQRLGARLHAQVHGCTHP